MALNTKKLSLYAIAGIATAIIIIAAISTSGIQLPSNANSQNPIALGTLVVAIKDAPVELSKLYVTIDSVEVQNQDSGWIKLPFSEGKESVNFDLLTLQDISQDLSTTLIPEGDYSKIRLHVKDATATYSDDSTADLNVPSDKIDIIIKFQIKEGETTNVLIDMTASISNQGNLKPVFKATATAPTSVSTTDDSPNLSTPLASPTETPEPSSEIAEPTPAPTPAEIVEPTPTPEPTTLT
jgi:hypothetical protein